MVTMAQPPPASPPRPAKPAKPMKPARVLSDDDASGYSERISKTREDITPIPLEPSSPRLAPLSIVPTSPVHKPMPPPGMRRAPSESSLDGEPFEIEALSPHDESTGKTRAKSPMGKGGGKLAKMLGEVNLSQIEEEGKKMKLGYEIPASLEVQLQDPSAVAKIDVFTLLAEYEGIGKPPTSKPDRRPQGPKMGGIASDIVHIRVGFRQIITGADDQIIMYASLFCNEEKKFLTNDFIFTPSISKAGLTAGTQELDCLFTDIKVEDIARDLKLVVRVYRRGTEENDGKEEGVIQFQRPLGCAVLNLDLAVHHIMKKPTSMKSLDAPIYESPKNEKEFLNIHNLICAKVKPKEITKELPRSQIVCEIGIFMKPLEVLASESADFASFTQVLPLITPELRPGEERHVLMLNLLSADVQPSFKNVGIRINVRNSKREHVPGCVSRGLTMTTGKTGTFKSCVYYNTNTPIWNEKLTIHLPRKLQTLSDWHLYVEMIQESAKEHVVFSFAYLPIAVDGQALIRNQVHTLQGYKYSRKHPEVMDTYLTYSAAMKQQRQTADKVLIESQLLSTIVCDDPDLYRLINWYAVPVDEILNNLDRCVNKSPTALVGVHKALLDSCFEMLGAKKIQSAQPILPSEGSIVDYSTFSCEDAVLSGLSFILGYLTSSKALDYLDVSEEARDSQINRPNLAELRSGTKRDLGLDAKATLPKGTGIAAAAAEKQAAQDAMQALEQKTKALEKKKQETGAKWKEVVNYYVDNFSTAGAHRALMYYINSIFTWALSAQASTLSASALTTHPRIASTTRLIEAFEYVWRLMLNSAKMDLSKSKAAGKMDPNAFKERLRVVFDTIGRFVAGDREIEEGVSATGAFLNWLTAQRTAMIPVLLSIAIRTQVVLAPLGVLAEDELCRVIMGILSRLSGNREESIQGRTLSTYRMLFREGLGNKDSLWFEPVLRQSLALVRGTFETNRDPLQQAKGLPLLGDMIRLLSGQEFTSIIPNLPAGWPTQLAKREANPEFVETLIQDMGALLPEFASLIDFAISKPELTMEGEFLGPSQPKEELAILKETVTTFVGLIELFWTPERIGHMAEFFFAADGPSVIAVVLQLFRSIVGTTAYPKFWVALRIKEMNAAVHVLQTSVVHLKKMPERTENRQLAVEAWILLAFTALVDPVVNLELVKEEPKRELLAKLMTDYRDALAGNVSTLFPRVADLHVALIPTLIEPIFQVALRKRPALNQLAVSSFRSLLGAELKANGNLELTLSASIDATGKLVREYAKKQQLREVEQTLRQLFAAALSSYAQKGEFEAKIIQLLSQLTTLEEMQRKPQFEDERAAAACKLIQVLKDTGKAEVLQTYLEFLQELHTSLGNSIEAANVVMYEQSLISWNTGQRARKIKLLEHAIALYAEVQWWEKSIQSCQLLQQGYNEWMMFEPMSALLKQQASFLDQITSKERIFPAFYRVALFGNGFGAQNGQEFVYRSGNGANLEGVRDFTLRMQEKFKGATMINSSDPIPEEKTSAADAKFVQITTLTPSSREELANKPHSKDHLRGLVSPRVLAYYYQCETDVFTYTRVKSQNKDKNANEFKDLVLEKWYLVTEEALPGMKRCASVVSRECVVRPPIESALVNIITKNRELEDLIWKVQNADMVEAKKMHGPLSMNLSGVIDAAVMGGVDKYREAFFTGSYLEANPAHKPFVVQFAVAMEHQLTILDKGLKLFMAQCDETLKPLTLHLQTTLEKMNVSVRRDIISQGTAKYHKNKADT